MATDTTVNNLIINKLTKAQYEAIVSPSDTELYLVPDEIDSTPTSGSDNPVKSGGVYTALGNKQDTLVSGTNIKTINNESLLGSGNIDIQGSGSGSGEDNVIEVVKVNGTALTPDGNKAVDVSVPTKVSDLTNDSGFLTGMTILSYGSSTWNDFITAYNAKKVVYCRASLNSNPASGSQTRLAFMAYVNNASTPTEVEFQYYRSIGTHSASQQGDQVFVYKLTSGGTWTVTTREATTKIVASTGLQQSYSNGTLTVSLGASIPSKTSDLTNDSGFISSETDPTVPSWAKASSKPTYTASEVGALPDDTSIPDSLSDLSEDTTHRTVTDTEKSTWNSKGTYSKPSGGIPKTDLDSSVQNSLGLADTALQSESDPVFSVSAASGITSSDISNWNSKTSNVGTITGVSVNGTSVATSGVANITSVPASILNGAIPSEVTATTQSQGDNSTKVATTAYVDTAITSLPEPMVFKGSLGTGGTITTLPAASSSNEGYTYKVITAGTYASQAAKIGDTFISDGSAWILIPSGDEPSGTVTSVTINATSPIAIDNSAAITTSGTRTISHATSGVTAGTYRSVTVNATGHVTGGTNPTTLSGYEITDAYTKTEADDKYVTALGTSGNNLTWTKDGTTNNITVPYSEKTTSIEETGYFSGNVNDLQTPIGEVKFHGYISKNAVNLFPTTNNANIIASLSTTNSDNYYHQLGFGPTGLWNRWSSGGSFNSWSKILTEREGLPEQSIAKGYTANVGYVPGAVTPTLLPLVATTSGNKLIFLPADQIIIEQTVDGGTTWTSGGYSDAEKAILFAGNTLQSNIKIPKIDNVKNKLCGVRITITGMKYNVPANTTETEKYNYWNSEYISSCERYVSLSGIYIWLSSNSDKIRTRVYRATGSNPNNWVSADNGNPAYLSGWSGGNYIFLNETTFGGGTNQAGNYWNYRIVCFTDGANGGDLSTNSTTSQQAIYRICGYGQSVWTSPNSFAGFNHLYSWDVNQNMTVPASLYPRTTDTAILGNASLFWNALYVNNIYINKAKQICLKDNIDTFRSVFALPYVLDTNRLQIGSGTSNLYPTDIYGKQIYLRYNGTNIGLTLNDSGNVTITNQLTSTGLLTASEGITVPSGKTITIGGKAVLTDHQDISGLVPNTRKVNNKALSADISLTASDVNALSEDTDVVLMGESLGTATFNEGGNN